MMARAAEPALAEPKEGVRQSLHWLNTVCGNWGTEGAKSTEGEGVRQSLHWLNPRRCVRQSLHSQLAHAHFEP